MDQVYLIHFEDGGEAYLTHFGVKGMKWGVRNAETLARYARGKVMDAVNEAQDVIGGGGGFTDEENEEEENEHSDLWEKKKREGRPEEDMYEVNPFYNEGAHNLFQRGDGQIRYSKEVSLINCATCSLVYDLRRRGYDVSANATTNMATQLNSKNISDYYKDATPDKYSNYDDCISKMKSYPDGARGTFSGKVRNGGGHAIAWEKKDGKITYYDCQSSTKYTEESVKKLFDMHSRSDRHKFEQNAVYCNRLDDKQPNLRRMRTDGLVTSMNKSEKYRTQAYDKNTVEKQHMSDWDRHLKGAKTINKRQKRKLGVRIVNALFGRGEQ